MFCVNLTTLCCTTDLNGVTSACRECSTSADEIVQLSETARSNGETAIQYVQHVQQVLASLKDIQCLNPDTFMQFKSLVDDDGGRAKKTLEGVNQMDDLALACVQKARGISDSLQRGVDALPAQVKDDLMEDASQGISSSINNNQARSLETVGGGRGAGLTDDADDDERALAKLLDVDENVTEVENSTRGVGDLSLFSVAVKGRGIFEGLSSKNALCTQIFERIQSVATTISRICAAFAGGNCCLQLQAVTVGAGDLVKCIRLSNLIQRAAEAAGKLIRAIVSFFRAVGDKFRGCLDEFDAAKKIGNFVKDHNPVKLGQSLLGRIG
jgi:hypothetical protein